MICLYSHVLDQEHFAMKYQEPEIIHNKKLFNGISVVVREQQENSKPCRILGAYCDYIVYYDYCCLSQ